MSQAFLSSPEKLAGMGSKEARRAEMRKLFAKVDLDGSGDIDQEELGKLMTSVIGTAPSSESVERMMGLMDKDGDKSIQEKEFLDRMEELLDQFEKTSGKRPRDGADSSSMSSSSSAGADKATLHKQMKLVMGFTEHKDLESGVAKDKDQYHAYAKMQFQERIGVFMERLGQANTSVGGGGGSSLDDGATEALWRASIHAKQPLEQQQALRVVSGLYLDPSRQNLWKEVLKELIQPTSPESLHAVLSALDCCLGLMDDFPSSEERYTLSAVFNDMFHNVSNLQDPTTGSVFTIRQCLCFVADGSLPTQAACGSNFAPGPAAQPVPVTDDLRLLAFRCLRRYVSGPRIPFAPPEDLFSASACTTKHWALNSGAFAFMVAHLEKEATSLGEVALKEEAMRFVGNLCEHDTEVAVGMLQYQGGKVLTIALDEHHSCCSNPDPTTRTNPTVLSYKRCCAHTVSVVVETAALSLLTLTTATLTAAATLTTALGSNGSSDGAEAKVATVVAAARAVVERLAGDESPLALFFANPEIFASNEDAPYVVNQLSVLRALLPLEQAFASDQSAYNKLAGCVTAARRHLISTQHASTSSNSSNGTGATQSAGVVVGWLRSPLVCAHLSHFVDSVITAHPQLLHDLAVLHGKGGDGGSGSSDGWGLLMGGIRADLRRVTEAGGGGAAVAYTAIQSLALYLLPRERTSSLSSPLSPDAHLSHPGGLAVNAFADLLAPLTRVMSLSSVTVDLLNAATDVLLQAANRGSADLVQALFGDGSGIDALFSNLKRLRYRDTVLASVYAVTNLETSTAALSPPTSPGGATSSTSSAMPTSPGSPGGSFEAGGSGNMAREFLRPSYNLLMVRASVQALSVLLDKYAASSPLIASQFTSLDRADSVAELFELVRSDVKKGQLVVGDSGEVQAMVGELKTLLLKMFPMQEQALNGQGGSSSLPHPRQAVKDLWDDLWKAALEGRASSGSSGGESASGGGAMGDTGDGMDDGENKKATVVRRKAFEDDDLLVESGSAGASGGNKLTRFEPTWLDGDCEPEFYDLDVLKAQHFNHDLSAMLTSMRQEMSQRHCSGGGGGGSVVFRMWKKSDPAMEIMRAQDLAEFLLSLEYRQQGSQPVIYMLKDGGAGAVEQLPPKNVALALVAKDHCNKGTFEAIYDAFKRMFPKQDKLEPDQFAHLMSATRTAHGQSDEQVRTMFAAFDTNGDGRIDFTEILVGLSVLLGGDLDEKLDLLFTAFDGDRSETMDSEELARMIQFLNDSVTDVSSARNMAQNLITKHDTEAGAEGAAAVGFQDFALNRTEFTSMVKANRWVLGNNWSNTSHSNNGFKGGGNGGKSGKGGKGGGGKGGGGNGGGGGFRQQMTCNNCGKQGHTQVKCYRPGGGAFKHTGNTGDNNNNNNNNNNGGRN